MNVQPPNPGATNSTVEKDLPQRMQVNYSSKQMKEAIEFGKEKRKARQLSEKNTSMNIRLDNEEEGRRAKKQSLLFRDVRVKQSTQLPLADRQRLSNPATRCAADPQIQKIRQMHADRFTAYQIAEADKKTDSHQGVVDRRDAFVGGFDRTCGASVKQPSGNSKPIEQDFCPATFLDFVSSMDTDNAKELFNDLPVQQQNQFCDYYLNQCNNQSSSLLEVLFP